MSRRLSITRPATFGSVVCLPSVWTFMALPYWQAAIFGGVVTFPFALWGGLVTKPAA
jgi:hypothetical protein